MFYVFGAELGWIIAALAVGFAVGWLTTTRASDGEFSGGWVVLAGLLLIGAGFAISSNGAIPGRDGLVFDTGLWLATAYAAGLPLGGGAKLLAPAPTPAPVTRPKIVVVRGEPAKQDDSRLAGAPQAASAPQAVAPAHQVAAPNDPAPAHQAIAIVDTAPAPQTKTAEIPAAQIVAPPAPRPEPIQVDKPAPKRANGKAPASVKPGGLTSPRNGAPDDLSKIKGVGPKSREKLHALGVFHYDQIAAWTPEEARWIGAALGDPGRVERNGWVAQAKSLAQTPP
jgi:predicted flap endonuclease-1-like 5' DNA nuclease